MLYFEDIEIGRSASFGHCLVTREEVIEFATKYDPQPFHLSDEAAAKTYFGRLSASGWHSCAMVMAMLVEHSQSGEGTAGLGSPGLDTLRWHKPVFPGDTLRCESEVVEKTRSRSRPEMGSYLSMMRVFNQHDEMVMSFKSIALIRTRNPT